jgi:hypothetical protein
MADQFITELDAITDFDDTDLLVIEKNPGGTPETNKITIADYVAKYLVRNTYQISRTVSSNNLIVAIKDSDGNNPTTAKPLYFNIGGFIRKVTGTLSVQVNSGTSTFNLGSAETLNLPHDLFVYVGWRASDSSVFIMLHRLPFYNVYAGISGTAANENYGAYSGATPAAADVVINIGRVNVINSGTASYNWSVPAGTIVINRPIFITEVYTYTPTIVGFSANPTNVVYQYYINRKNMTIRSREATNGTSNGTTFTMTTPFTSVTLTNGAWQTIAVPVTDNGTASATPGFVQIASAASIISVNRDALVTAWTNANGKRVGYFELTFPIGL